MIHTGKLTFVPLYMQVKKAILERIIKGEWRPGSFLPSEIALAEEYGVSQGTLRKALNSLTREKRLVRYQGKGTAVAILDEDSSLFPFFQFKDRQGNRVYPVSQVCGINRGLPNASEQSCLGIRPDEPVLRIERVRILHNMPVINEKITLISSRFPGFELAVDKIPNTLYEHYQLNFGITIARATEQVDATLATPQDIERMGVQERQPLLLLTRISYDLEDLPVEFRISHVDTTRDFIYQANLN